MKRITTYLLVLLLMVPFWGTYAQDAAEVTTGEEVAEERNWKMGGFVTGQIGQIALVNWAAGGKSSVSVNLIGNAYANFAKNKHVWDNTFNGSWGLLKNKGEDARKNTDILELNSKYGYKIADKWSAGALLDFKSQFSWGFDYPEDGSPKILTSKFAAPATIKLSLGFDYKPNDEFSLFLSPATGKFIFVREDARIDETRYGLDEGDIVRVEFGAYMRANLQKEIFKNVSLRSTLEVFNNYTDPDKGNRKNFDVDWQTGIDMKINEWLSASLLGHLIYDHNVAVPVDRDGDGLNESTGPRTQFREAFTLGITYKFDK